MEDHPHRDGEPLLYLERDLIEEHVGPGAFGEVVVFSARSPANPTCNEDAAGLFPAGGRRVVLAVADGLGGQPSGEHAAGLAMQALRSTIIEACAACGSIREAILSGFDRANRAVIEHGAGGATTMVVVEIDGRELRTYHVGDSGALLFGGRGRVKLQTIAHSPVGYAVEAGLLDEKDAMVHEDRHLVSNVIGDPGMHVGVSSLVGLRRRDTLVLASDGLFDNLHVPEIVEYLRRGALVDGVRALVQECRERMLHPAPARPSKPDDLTLLAYRPPRPTGNRGRGAGRGDDNAAPPA